MTFLLRRSLSSSSLLLLLATLLAPGTASAGAPQTRYVQVGMTQTIGGACGNLTPVHTASYTPDKSDETVTAVLKNTGDCEMEVRLAKSATDSTDTLLITVPSHTSGSATIDQRESIILRFECPSGATTSSCQGELRLYARRKVKVDETPGTTATVVVADPLNFGTPAAACGTRVPFFLHRNGSAHKEGQVIKVHVAARSNTGNACNQFLIDPPPTQGSGQVGFNEAGDWLWIVPPGKTVALSGYCQTGTTDCRASLTVEVSDAPKKK